MTNSARDRPPRRGSHLGYERKPGCRCLLSFLAALNLLGPITPAQAAPPGSQDITAVIDLRLAEGWTAARVRPAARADDATFHRRVMLDLIGRIPTGAESAAFLEDKSADKRTRLVRRLVSSAGHARHTATFWRQQWVPQANVPQFALLADEIDDWLAGRLREGASYDQLARELITASPQNGTAPPSNEQEKGFAAFLAASEYKPENLAANTARAFLGINLDCAQCHDHPFARWTRNQFWETAAFFARPAAANALPVRLQLEIPDTRASVGPKFLSDPQPVWPDALHDDTGRKVLAQWVASPDNPWFARNAVNRLWAALLGSGIVEPLDDLSAENAASHPQLLDELAQAFRESGFDLKLLTTAIVLSEAYQLSSTETSEDVTPDPRLFNRFNVRAISGEQLFDSLRIAAGMPPVRDDVDTQAVRERSRFAERFRGAGGPQRSILQALSLMNGDLTSRVTHPEKSPTLRAIADAPFLDAPEKIDLLFLAAIGRLPTGQERHSLAAAITAADNDLGARSALADILWALVNSSEFSTNH